MSVLLPSVFVVEQLDTSQHFQNIFLFLTSQEQGIGYSPYLEMYFLVLKHLVHPYLTIKILVII